MKPTSPDRVDQTQAVALRLHGRQFVIGPRAFAAAEDWRSTPLRSAIVSYCPLLHVATSPDAQGNSWMLVGTAVQSDPARPDPIDEIALTSSAHVADLCDTWVGRWVLVGDSIYLDASGTLGCYFGTDRDGAPWVSSSPALLSRILFGEQAPVPDSRVLRYEVGISWFVPPRSRFRGMHRLLPSQSLTVSGRVRPRPYMTSIDPTRPVEEICEELTTSLVTTMQRAACAQPLWLGLTAGADSRLVLAVTHRAAVPFSPYTRLAPRMTLADRLLPPRLCADLGCRHTSFPFQTTAALAERRRLIAEQGAGHIADDDVQPLLYGTRDSLSGTTIGGNCFGVGKAWGRRTLPRDVTAIDAALPSIAAGLGEPLASSGMKGVYEWLTWCRDNPTPHLDWRDRFFLELRNGGWLSAKEQIYDMTPLNRFVPINSMRNYALLLSFPEALRHGAEHQAIMIRQLTPELLHHPFNPGDLYFGVLPALLGRARHPMQVAARGRQKLRRAWNSVFLNSAR